MTLIASGLATDPFDTEAVKQAVSEGKIEIYEIERGREEKKTVGEILNARYCLGDEGHFEYTSFKDSFGENFKQVIMTHLHAGIANNKKYYLDMQNKRRLVYFRMDSTYYLQLMSMTDGEPSIIGRYFTSDDMEGCIKSLPDGCKFQGNQKVTYEKKCRVGKNVGKELIKDFIQLSTTATEDEVSFAALMTAFRECYSPQCYNVEFSCLEYQLNYDRTEVLQALRKIAQDITDEDNNLNAYVNEQTLTLKYSGTKIGVVQGATEPAPEPLPVVNP
jgi:hypothetical protein